MFFTVFELCGFDSHALMFNFASQICYLLSNLALFVNWEFDLVKFGLSFYFVDFTGFEF